MGCPAAVACSSVVFGEGIDFDDFVIGGALVEQFESIRFTISMVVACLLHDGGFVRCLGADENDQLGGTSL